MGGYDIKEVIDTDLLVIGGGLAGCYAAIKAREYGVLRVLLIEKGRVSRTGMSNLGAGVMLIRFPEDDLSQWTKEMVEHGEFVNDQEWLQVMAEQSYGRLEEMISWGIDFKRNEDGSVKRAQGRGTRPDGVLRNVMFPQGQLMPALRSKLRQAGVTMLEGVMVTDLLVSHGQAAGAVAIGTRTAQAYIVQARAVINAAGSNAYKGTFSGHKNVTGDAWAMMWRRGVQFISMEFATANSTARDFDLIGAMNMLVGLGGRFINGLGEPFMERYDPVYRDQASLPRLTAAMAMEVHEGRGPIYLDMRTFGEKEIKLLWEVVPISMETFHAARIDIRRQPVEWMPAMIGFGTGRGGGAWIDLACRTNIPGLWAIGDAAWNSFQGAGAAGGPNFPFCAVSGDISAASVYRFIQNKAPEPEVGEADFLLAKAFCPLQRKEGILAEDVLIRLQEAMFRYDTWLLRSGAGLQRALGEVERLRKEELPLLYARDPHELRLANEVANMLVVAEVQLRAALAREESRGANVREDFPETDNVEWLKWIVIQKNGEETEVRKVPIPLERYDHKPDPGRHLHAIFAGAKGKEGGGYDGNQKYRPQALQRV